jgi:hypothetical protein
MTSQVIKENIITTSYRQANAPCLPYDYDLIYNSSTGEVNVVRKVGSGGNISEPLKSSSCDYIFTNGTFTQAAIDTFGQENINNLFDQLKVDVNKTIKIIGGTGKGIIPSFLGNSTFSIAGQPTISQTASSQQNLSPSSTLGNPSSQTTGSTTASAQTFTNTASSGSSSYNGGAFNSLSSLNVSANEKTKYGSGSEKLLIYPEDLIRNGQDTLHITEYNYKSPSGSELLGGNPGNILSGLQKIGIAGTKEFLGTVILPIPNNIADNNSVAWGADTMNNLTAAATAQVMGNLALSGLGAAAGQGMQALTGFNPTPLAVLSAVGLKADLNDPAIRSQLEAALGSQILKMAQFDVPPETILARGLGIVPNSNLELLFQGPTLREFSFGWRLSPRSENEAKTVKKIIRVFKQGMAARKLNSGAAAGVSAALLGTPNIFKLEYKTGNTAISSLNKFKLCALTNFSVNYAPDGQWAAFEDSQPVSLTIGMSFTEIEPIFESDYQNNITGTLSGFADLSEVGENDIGY